MHMNDSFNEFINFLVRSLLGIAKTVLRNSWVPHHMHYVVRDMFIPLQWSKDSARRHKGSCLFTGAVGQEHVIHAWSTP